MKARIIVGFATVVAAIVLVAAIMEISRLTLLRPAPEVRFTTLAGETFSTSQLRGKVVLVNFWATYCASCVQEMPRIVDAHHKFAPRGYETVAVAVRQDNPQRVAKFASSRALPFRVALDSSGEIAKEFGNVRLTPVSFVIDRQGRVLRRFVGEPNWSEFHDLVEHALAS
jgi:peroxiredoxin